MSELSAADEARIADETWQALREADVFVEGDFTFASGHPATLKVDMERLYDHPPQLEVIMGNIALMPCVQRADLLTYVPNGMREMTTTLGKRLNIPVADTRKHPSNERYAFEFTSAADQVRAIDAIRPVILEDVVTTLGSVAGLRSLFPDNRLIDMVGILRRDTVLTTNQIGLVEHYLLEKDIPTDMYKFRQLYSTKF